VAAPRRSPRPARPPQRTSEGWVMSPALGRRETGETHTPPSPSSPWFAVVASSRNASQPATKGRLVRPPAAAAPALPLPGRTPAEEGLEMKPKTPRGAQRRTTLTRATRPAAGEGISSSCLSCRLAPGWPCTPPSPSCSLPRSPSFTFFLRAVFFPEGKIWIASSRRGGRDHEEAGKRRGIVRAIARAETEWRRPSLVSVHNGCLSVT